MPSNQRFQRRSLRDLLVSQGVLTDEVADELISSARQSHEPFSVVVVNAGYITSWDMAKLIATHFQMPVMPLAGFQFDRELYEGLPPATLYQYLMLPVGRFGQVCSFAVTEPPSRECQETLRELCGPNVFFFVSEVPEVQRLLRENIKVVDATADKGWEALFDTAEQSVLGGSPQGEE